MSLYPSEHVIPINQLPTNNYSIGRRQPSSPHNKPHPLSINNYTVNDDVTLDCMSSTDNELLISILSYKLHLIDIKRRYIPLITYPLLRLFLRDEINNKQYMSRGNDNTFFSYTEADSIDASLVLDVDSLHIFQNEINALHYASHNSIIDQPNKLIQIVGPVLRAIQICEGSSGLIGGRNVISDVSGVLAKYGFSIFYVSTGGADYVLVNESQLNDIVVCLNTNFKLLRDSKDSFDSPELDAIPHKSTHHNKQQHQHDLQFNLSDVSSNASPALSAQSPNIYSSNAQSHHKLRKPKPTKWNDVMNDDHHTQFMTDDISPSGSSTNDTNQPSTNNTASMFSTLNLDGQSSKQPIHPSTPPRHNNTNSISYNITPQESPTSAARKLQLRTLPHALSILSLHKRSLPSISHILLNTIFFPQHGLSTARFFSYTVIDDEISIICDISTYAALQLSLQGQTQSIQYTQHSNNHSPLHIDRRNIVDQWIVLEAVGYYDIHQIGLVSTLSQPLSDANINFFYFSTFRTGFVLIRNNDLDNALNALSNDFEIEKTDLYNNIHQMTQNHFGGM